MLDDMEPQNETVQTSQPGEDRSFTRHGTPVSPVSSEDDIRTAAASVVPSIPLPDPFFDTQTPSVATSEVYGTPGVQQSDIGDLTAEDIHEESL